MQPNKSDLSHYFILPGPRERDLIVMHHEIGIQWPDYKQETRHIDFVYYGDPDKYSAMSATVGFTTGIATKMVLEGRCIL